MPADSCMLMSFLVANITASSNISIVWTISRAMDYVLIIIIIIFISLFIMEVVIRNFDIRYNGTLLQL